MLCGTSTACWSKVRERHAHRGMRLPRRTHGQKNKKRGKRGSTFMTENGKQEQSKRSRKDNSLHKGGSLPRKSKWEKSREPEGYHWSAKVKRNQERFWPERREQSQRRKQHRRVIGKEKGRKTQSSERAAGVRVSQQCKAS